MQLMPERCGRPEKLSLGELTAWYWCAEAWWERCADDGSMPVDWLWCMLVPEVQQQWGLELGRSTLYRKVAVLKRFRAMWGIDDHQWTTMREKYLRELG